MLARIRFLLHFYRAQLPHGRTPIASHTSLFTGVVPCPPVDFCPTNRLNFSSPRTGRGGELLITAFFLSPRSRGKRLECEQRQRREVSRLVCWVGGESGPICILCSVARSWEPQAGSAKFDPKARAAAVSAAGCRLPVTRCRLPVGGLQHLAGGRQPSTEQPNYPIA